MVTYKFDAVQYPNEKTVVISGTAGGVDFDLEAKDLTEAMEKTRLMLDGIFEDTEKTGEDIQILFTLNYGFIYKK